MGPHFYEPGTEMTEFSVHNRKGIDFVNGPNANTPLHLPKWDYSQNFMGLILLLAGDLNKNDNKHNAELQRIDPGTEDTANSNTGGCIFQQRNGFLSCS